jgi:hypothetical protein
MRTKTDGLMTTPERLLTDHTEAKKRRNAAIGPAIAGRPPFISARLIAG